MLKLYKSFKQKFTDIKSKIKHEDVQDLMLPVNIVKYFNQNLSGEKLKDEIRDELRNWMNENDVTKLDEKTVHVINKVLDDKSRPLDEESARFLKDSMKFHKYAQDTRMHPYHFLGKASEKQYEIAGSFAKNSEEYGGAFLHLAFGFSMKILQGLLDYQVRKLGL